MTEWKWGQRVAHIDGTPGRVRGWDRNGEWLWVEFGTTSFPNIQEADAWTIDETED